MSDRPDIPHPTRQHYIERGFSVPITIWKNVRHIPQYLTDVVSDGVDLTKALKCLTQLRIDKLHGKKTYCDPIEMFGIFPEYMNGYWQTL